MSTTATQSRVAFNQVCHYVDARGYSKARNRMKATDNIQTVEDYLAKGGKITHLEPHAGLQESFYLSTLSHIELHKLKKINYAERLRAAKENHARKQR
ncbi:MAG: hypothetical protein V3V88_02855 [Dehalococcoidia bacterium]